MPLIVPIASSALVVLRFVLRAAGSKPRQHPEESISLPNGSVHMLSSAQMVPLQIAIGNPQELGQFYNRRCF
jgi:hypothetical protein